MELTEAKPPLAYVEEFRPLFSRFIRDESRPTAYVAGPMRNFPQFNYPAFDAARDRLVGAGYNVISPADIDRASDKGVDTITPEQANSPAMCRVYAYRDVAAIFFVDVVAVLPGWERSVGATAEVALARWLKTPVICATTLEAVPPAAPEAPR